MIVRIRKPIRRYIVTTYFDSCLGSILLSPSLSNDAHFDGDAGTGTGAITGGGAAIGRAITGGGAIIGVATMIVGGAGAIAGFSGAARCWGCCAALPHDGLVNVAGIAAIARGFAKETIGLMSGAAICGAIERGPVGVPDGNCDRGAARRLST